MYIVHVCGYAWLFDEPNTPCSVCMDICECMCTKCAKCANVFVCAKCAKCANMFTDIHTISQEALLYMGALGDHSLALYLMWTCSCVCAQNRCICTYKWEYTRNPNTNRHAIYIKLRHARLFKVLNAEICGHESNNESRGCWSKSDPRDGSQSVLMINISLCQTDRPCVLSLLTVCLETQNWRKMSVTGCTTHEAGGMHSCTRLTLSVQKVGSDRDSVM